MVRRSTLRGCVARWTVGALGLSLLCLSCSGRVRHSGYVLSDPPCLRGAVPYVRRAVPDEMFALMRRELARAERPSSGVIVGACTLEVVPDLFPDVSDRSDAPTCAPDLAEHMSDQIFDQSPIAYSRMLIARVRSIGFVGDTTDVMDRKAALLLRIYRLKDSELTDYQLATEESGPPPSKAYLRSMALALLARSNLFLNSRAVRDHLIERVTHAADDEQILLLHVNSAYADEALWGHPTQPTDNGAPTLLQSWVPDLRRRLNGTAGRVSLEIALARLQAIGAYGGRFGANAQAREVIADVLARHGALPITQGIEGAARDLDVIARGALYDLDVASESVGISEPPPPAHAPYDPWPALLHDEPAGGRAVPGQVAVRVRDLEQELSQLRFAPSRCHALNQLARWLPSGEAEARFEALAAPMFDAAGNVVFSSETMCRMWVLLELDAVTPARRIALLRRLLIASPDRITSYDSRGDEHNGFYIYNTDPTQIRNLAGRALARHLDWIDQDDVLRQWLIAQAQVPSPEGRALSGNDGIDSLEPAFTHALMGLARGDAAQREVALQIMRAWIVDTRAVLSSTNITSVYPYDLAKQRLYALAETAPMLGATEEARVLCAQILDRDPASSLGGRYVERHNGVARAATIALHRLQRPL